ncbi:hypothetical protein AZI98_01395 [Aeribacillus pallidus]|uniref:Uncharacterized protein n=1 Tax=Aeribacillus pallidus TaxID=33936 RepID=A0A161YV52_9BACI|nr:hypothetical protein [Aeribacillus pallidus]KZN97825.1 hypothetical protein AZI98_01395 [Aeribacillus pallidus]
MPVKETFHTIRKEQSAPSTTQQKMFKALLFLFSGMLLCLITKYSDTVPANGFFGNIWSLISDITTRLGI